MKRNRIRKDDKEQQMTASLEQFVVDGQGRRTAVLLDIERYRELLEAEEEIESVRAYDQAKESGDQAVPFDQAVREIEAARQ